MSIQPRDRRASERRPCSRSIWWRRHTGEIFQQGWMVDESERGIAFLTRASEPPRPGEPIQAAPQSSGPGVFAAREAHPRGVIRRVQRIQSGVVLVAAELFSAEREVVTRPMRQRAVAA